MELWEKVSETTKDTKTKEVSYWSRQFTAIDAYSQIKTATEQFWKYWEKWGFKDISYDVISERIYFVWNFFYPDWDFPIFNDQKVWDDAAKKVFTDSLTKALSYLWFNADVFMGQFDWNKYTWDWSGNKKAYKKDPNKPDLMDYINRIKDENDINALSTLWEEINEITWSQKQIDWLTKEKDKKKNILQSK